MCDLTFDKDIICFLAVLKKCQYTVQDTVIREKKERNGTIRVDITYNL